MNKILALLLALTLLLALSACGQKAEEKAPEVTAAPAETPEAAPAETEAPAEPTPEPGDAPKVALFWNALEGDADQAPLREAIVSELSAAGFTVEEFYAANEQKRQLDQVSAAASGDYVAFAVDLVDEGLTDSAWAVLAVAGETPVAFFDRAMEAEDEAGVILGMNDNTVFLSSAAQTDGSGVAKALCTFVTALSEGYPTIDAAAEVVIHVPGCTMADGFTNKILIG